MGSVNITTFYPDNAVTNAAEVNNNNNAIASSTGGINEKNVRAEGIDHRQFKDNPIMVYTHQQVNGTPNPPIGTAGTVHNGWRYRGYSDPATPAGEHYGAREYPINHDNTYAINTNVNQGTKLQVNSTNGIALKNDMMLRVYWSVNVWTISDIHTLWGDNYASSLIGTGNAGAGIGEWCFLIYPKFNTVSSALNDNEFFAADNAGIYTVGPTAFFDAEEGAAGTLYSFTTRRWDHTSVVPMHFMCAGPGGTNGAIARYAYYNPIVNEAYSVGGYMQISGEICIPCDNGSLPGADMSKTLHGIQLFCGGAWRMNGINLALSTDPTNPGGGDYGIDSGITITRAAVGLQLYGYQAGSL